MNPEILFKITIKCPAIEDGQKEPDISIFYVFEDCNKPEIAIQRAIKEYHLSGSIERPYWESIKIETAEGTLVK